MRIVGSRIFLIAVSVLVPGRLDAAVTGGSPAAAAASASPSPAAGSTGLAELTGAERAAFDTLVLLASPDPARIVEGLVAAGQSGLGLFEPPAFAMLSHVEAGVRAAASTTLARIEWPDTNAGLVERIGRLAATAGDEVPAVRRAAIEALGTFAVAQSATALGQLARGAAPEEAKLVEAAQDGLGDPRTMERLGRWLRRRGAAREIPAPLLAARTLVTAPGGSEALAALELLATLEPASATRPFVHLAARRGSVSLRARPADVMGVAPAAADVPVLLALFADSSPTVRKHSAKALGGVAGQPGVAAAAARQLGREQTSFVEVRGPGEERVGKVDLMRAEASALRKAPTPELMVALEPTLRGSSGYARELAIFLLRERTGRETVWPKLQALWMDPNDGARKELFAEPLASRQAALLPHLADVGPALAPLQDVLELVSPLGAEQAPAALALVAHDPAPELVAAVARATREAPDATVVPVLAQGLKQSGPAPTRLAFYKALLGRGTDEAVGATAQALRGEGQPALAAEVLGLVRGRKERPIVEAVRARLTLREPPVVARAAVAALEGPSDPELVGTVATLARSTDEGLARDAYERLRLERGELADGHVRRLAGDPDVLEPVRVLALADLGQRGGLDDRSMLEDVLRRGSSGERLAARKALHLLVPDVYPAWDALGRVPLIVSSAAFGAGLMGMVTRVAQRDEWLAVLGVGGGLIGGTTAYLLTLDRDVSLGGAGYFASLGTWGALGGYSFARMTQIGGGTPSSVLWATIGGELLGAGLGALTIESAAYDTSDVVLANLLAGSVGLAALSGTYLAHGEGPERTLTNAFTLGAAAAMVPMAFLGKRLELSKIDPVAVVVTTGLATWVGAFAPRAFSDDPRGNDILAGIGVGQAVGLAGGVALSHLRPFTPRSALWLGFGGLVGTAAGSGVGLAWPELQGRTTYQLLELGTVLGAAAGAWVGPQLEFHETDVVLVALMAAAGAFAGSGTAERAIEQAGLSGLEPTRTERQLWGGRLLGTAAGLVGGLTLSQFVDLSAGELAMAMGAAGVLGAGGGGIALLSPRLDDAEWFSPLFSAGAALGGLGIAALAPRLHYSSSDLALGVSAMMLGGFAGALAPAYWTREPEPLPKVERWGGAMVGAASGVALAGILSQATDLTPGHVLRIDLGALGGMAFGAGLGLVSPGLDRSATTALLEAGTAVGLVGTALFDRRPEYTPSDRMRLVLAAGVGAGAGTLVPSLWREHGIPAEERWGGALVGMTTLAGLARLGVVASSRDGGDVAETAVFTALGATVGGGAYGLRLGPHGGVDALFAATLLGWGLGDLASGSTAYDGADAALVMTLVAEGAVGGLALPRWLGETDDARGRSAGAALAGGALGLGGLALAQAVDLDRLDLFEASWVSVLGASTGYGAAYALGERRARWASTAAAALWGGLALGIATSSRTRYEGGEAGLAMLLTAEGAAAGLVVPEWLGKNGDASSRAAGAALGGGLLGLAGLGLTQVTSYEGSELRLASETSALAAAGAWGIIEAWDTPDPGRSRGVAGAALLGGLGVGLLAAPHVDVSKADAGWIAAGSALGAWIGYRLPEARLADQATTRAQLRGALGGAAAGALVAGAAAQGFERSPTDAVLGLVLGAGLTVGAEGAAKLALDAPAEQRALVAQAAALTGFAAGALLAPYSSFDRGEALGMAAFSLLGAWHGAFLPEALGRDPDPAGGAGSGSGLGLVVGYGLSQLFHPSPAVDGELLLASGVGSLVGYGLGATLDWSEQHTKRGLELGSAAALGLGAAVVPALRLDQADLPLVFASGLWGAWHGAWLGELLDSSASDARRVGGGVMLGSGVGLATGLALSQVVRRQPSDLFETSLLLGAGNLIGEGAGELLQLDRKSSVGLMEAGSLAGLAAGLALSPSTSYTTARSALVAASSLWGAWQGAWLGELLDSSSGGDRVRGGAMLGSGLGLAAGAAFSQLVDRQPGDLLETTILLGTGNLIGEGAGELLRLDRTSSLGLMEAGGLAGLATGLALSPSTSYGGSRGALVAASGVWGAWQGAWLGELLESSAGGDRLRGGVMLGSGLGLAGGLALSQLVERDPGDVIETTLLLGAGNLVGEGAGELLRLDHTSTVGLMEAAGVAGLAAGLALSPSTSYTATAGAVVATSGLWGGWHGAWLGALLDSSAGGDRVRGGAMLGSGLGVAAGVALSQVAPWKASDLVEASLMLGAGNLIGSGAGDVLHLGRTPTLGLLEAGGIAGMAAGLALAPGTSYEPTDGALVLVTTGIGASHGMMLRGLFAGEDEALDGRAVRGGATLGAGLGLAGGMLLTQRLSLGVGDLAEIVLATGCGDAIGYGLAEWTGLRGPGYYGAIEAGALGALALSLVSAQATSYTASDRLLIAWGATLGGWLGGWAPSAWGGDDRSRGAGILLGIGAGGLASAAAAQRLHLGASDTGEVVLGSSLSTAIGAGLGLLVSPDQGVWVALMDLAGVAGMAMVGANASSTEYSREDVMLGSLTAVYAVYQGAGVSILANASNRQVAGAMLAAGAGGALAGTYIGRRLHVDQTEMLMLLAGSAWGMWVGVWSAPLIADLRSSDRDVVALGVGTTALATDAALAITAIGISRLVEMPPRRFAWINLSGGFGVVVGAATAALTSGTARSFQTGCVVGSVAGLAAGTIVTGFFDFTPRRPIAAAAGDTDLGLASMLPGIETVIPSVQVVPRDPASGSREPGVMFTLLGSFR